MMSRSRAANDWVDFQHRKSGHQAMSGRLSPCNDHQVPCSGSGDVARKTPMYQLVALVRVQMSDERPHKFPVDSLANSELPCGEMSTPYWSLLHLRPGPWTPGFADDRRPARYATTAGAGQGRGNQPDCPRMDSGCSQMNTFAAGCAYRANSASSMSPGP